MTSVGAATYAPLAGRAPAATPANAPADATFADLLRSAGEGIRVSNHARKRIETRDLGLDATNLGRLNSAISRAAEKGAKSSVVVLDDLAVVVDIRERTIVTALQRDPTRERVFTNIDSVVIA